MLGMIEIIKYAGSERWFREAADLRVLRKAVIPAAGLGTRLLSVTKEQPKEMLPVFARGRNGDLSLKPIVQLVFEQLHQVGFREFCFIVGRGKRAIEDHFTPDFAYVSMLDSKGKNGVAEDLEAFYKMVGASTLVWVNQSEPRGFGDAVLKAKAFVGGESFLVHAGDSHFISRNADHLRRLVRMSEELKADALFLSQEVEDPRRFGVVEGGKVADGVVRVKGVVEKPEKPLSKLAIMPVYVFHSDLQSPGGYWGWSWWGVPADGWYTEDGGLGSERLQCLGGAWRG